VTIALARPLPDGYVSTQDDRHVIRRLAGAQWRRGGHSWACLTWRAFIGQQTSVSRDLPGIAENNSSATLRQRCPTASGFVPPIGVYSKATGHFAALGASNGELKEKRDRAEDAVCAVRGAIKFGCLPGGCWTLLKVVDELQKLKDDIIDNTLVPALRVPFERLLRNSGIIDADEMASIAAPIVSSIQVPTENANGDLVFFPVVYDALGADADIRAGARAAPSGRSRPGQDRQSPGQPLRPGRRRAQGPVARDRRRGP